MFTNHLAERSLEKTQMAKHDSSLHAFKLHFPTNSFPFSYHFYHLLQTRKPTTSSTVYVFRLFASIAFRLLTLTIGSAYTHQRSAYTHHRISVYFDHHRGSEHSFSSSSMYSFHLSATSIMLAGWF